MEDDVIIDVSQWIKGGDKINDLCDLLDKLLGVIKTLNDEVKSEKITKWLNGIDKGGASYKEALSAATSLVEELIPLRQKLIQLDQEETKELYKLKQAIKDKNRNLEKEAQIANAVEGSYARMKLELEQLTEQYKEANNISVKKKLATDISLLATKLMLADKELKNLTNDYVNLSEAEKDRFVELEKEHAESEAIVGSIKKRAKAEAELNEVTKNRSNAESTALSEQMEKLIRKRIELEAKELMLQDEQTFNEIRSLEADEQRLIIKEKLNEVQAKIKALESDEAKDLALYEVRASAKKKQLDTEAQILLAQSDEGKRLAESEEKLRRINQENERNAQIVNAVEGSYEQLKLILQEQEGHLKSINVENKTAFEYALAEIGVTQKKIVEADKWLSIVKQQATAETELGLLQDKEYQARLQSNKELSLEIKYTQGLVDSRAKLAAMQQAATNVSEGSNKSTLEEIRLNEELANAIKKTEDARAKAAFYATSEYKAQLEAERASKKAKLEAIVSNDELSGSIMAMEAKYELLQMRMEEINQTTREGTDAFNLAKKEAEDLGDKLSRLYRDMGKHSSIMTERQRAWNGLTNSVYQITRELPNLAVRADTFFLAISNNIPIFLEEFGRAQKALGSFRKAFMQTIAAFGKGLALAVPLLALSKWSEMVKVWDGWFNTLEDGTLKMDAFYRSFEGHVKNVSSQFTKQIYSIRMLSSEWKKLDIAGRSTFLYKYKEQIDATGLAITNLDEAENALVNNTDMIVEAFYSRAKAMAAMELASDKYKTAVEKAISVEGKASGVLGEDVTQSDLRKRFAQMYGISDEAQITTGKFKIGRETLDRLIKDYEDAYSRTANRFGVIFRLKGDRALKNMIDKLKELRESSDGIVEIDSATAEWISTLDDAGKGSLKMAKDLRELEKAIAQGDQAASKSAEYFDDWSNSIDEAGVSLTDLTKKLNDYMVKALKSYNDSLLELLNEQKFREGGLTVQAPTIGWDDATGMPTVILDEEKITNSFEKSRLAIRQGKQETIQELLNFQNELSKLKLIVGSEYSDAIQLMINQVTLTMGNLVQATRTELKQSELEEYSATAKVYADNLQLRLDALKEGSDEELDLRKRLIQANMQAEIAENATLEPIKQRSIAAIRAKYRREEELAEREYYIKLNNWRKQDLENEQAYVNQYTRIYASNQVNLERIAMQSELAENADLIEQGLISREAIIEKYNKKIEKIYDDHRAKLLSGEKSYWDMVKEFESEGSYEELTVQLKSYDLQLEAEKLQYKELIAMMPEYGRMLDELYAKRKRLAEGEYEQKRLEKQQDIEAIIFGISPQIGEQYQEMFDLKQEWERYDLMLKLVEAGKLENVELDDIYANLVKIGKAMQRLTGWQGMLSRVSEHGLLGLIQLNAIDPLSGKKTGKLTDLSSEQYDALDTAFGHIKDSIDSVMDSYVSLAQAAYDAAEAQVDAARTVYEAELEARANGYANDVEGAKRELALERNKAKQKEDILKAAQKRQAAINTATQISDLITASASILKEFASQPILMYTMLAGMWGAFSYAKIKANQVANTSSVYGEGGYELAVGGSHASGNDIKTGIRTKGGSQMVIEGGEGVGVFSRKAVTKYGDIIPNLVSSINSGAYGSMGAILDGATGGVTLPSDYISGISLLPMYNSVDLSTVEGLLSAILSKQVGQPIVLNDGSIMERKGNKTTIIRRS